MLEKMRPASRRHLTLANLLEKLAEARGGAEALTAGISAYRGLSAPTGLGAGDFLRLTNLAAEALIREWDLKKGERVAVLARDPGESLLISLAAIKAGAIVVPLPPELPEEELARRMEGCGVSLIIADGAFLAACPDAPGSLRREGRLAACGPREAVPPGAVSLHEAMERSSGFFLPYTLKPSSVVALFHHPTPPGKPRAVMATNEMLLWPGRVAAFLPFFRPGGLFLNALSPLTMAGFAASLAALLCGMQLDFLGEAETVPGTENRDGWTNVVFSASPRQYIRMLEAGVGGFGAASLRLWLCWGYGLSREAVAELGMYAAGKGRFPAPVMEACDAEGNAVMPAVRFSLRNRVWPRDGFGMAIPPNRMRVVHGSRSGEAGGRVLALKGPSVTPGYWNDLEATLEARKGGWLYCPL